jgi:hypothetical protein
MQSSPAKIGYSEKSVIDYLSPPISYCMYNISSLIILKFGYNEKMSRPHKIPL